FQSSSPAVITKPSSLETFSGGADHKIMAAACQFLCEPVAGSAGRSSDERQFVCHKTLLSFCRNDAVSTLMWSGNIEQMCAASADDAHVLRTTAGSLGLGCAKCRSCSLKAETLHGVLQRRANRECRRCIPSTTSVGGKE